jgi:hypothetical protein
MMPPIRGAKISGFLGAAVPPYKKYRYSTLKIPVFALIIPVLPQNQNFIYNTKIREKGRL